MTSAEKVAQLRALLCDTLLPLINNDYIFLDIPYYSNPGDTLIWEGTECLLKECSYKCLMKTAEECFKFPKLRENTIILLQGGGNWGDLWDRHQKFRLKVIQKYKNHRIIILPQSIYYKELDNWEKDATELFKHPDLHICVRDMPSCELVKDKNIKNVYLLPDMAFCINSKYLLQFEKSNNGRVLWVKRQDSEMPDYSHLKIDVDDTTLDIQDWPTMMSYDFVQINFYRIYNHRNFLLQGLTDLYADKILRPHIVKEAVRFISQYNYIYTSRLHVAILSVLLGKPFTLIDNSYGKNLNLYKAWLSDIDTIKLES